MNVSLSVKRIIFNKKKKKKKKKEEEEEGQTFCHLCHLIMDTFTHTDIFSTLHTQETSNMINLYQRLIGLII